MDIFQEKTMFFKPHFLHTNHKHFLLKFASIDREMSKLYKYNNLIILGKQYDDQNGRSLSTARSKFKIFEFRSGSRSRSAHKGNPIAIAIAIAIHTLFPISIPIAIAIPNAIAIHIALLNACLYEIFSNSITDVKNLQ